MDIDEIRQILNRRGCQRFNLKAWEYSMMQMRTWKKWADTQPQPDMASYMHKVHAHYQITPLEELAADYYSYILYRAELITSWGHPIAPEWRRLWEEWGEKFNLSQTKAIGKVE